MKPLKLSDEPQMHTDQRWWYTIFPLIVLRGWVWVGVVFAALLRLHASIATLQSLFIGEYGTTLSRLLGNSNHKVVGDA